MPDIQDEYVKQHVSAAQITNTIRLSQFFLVSILIVSLYVYCIYQFYFTKPSFYFNLWFITTELLSCLSLLITSIYFKPHNFALNHAHRWLQFQCWAIGCSIAVGTSLIYYYLPQYNPNFSYVNALIL